MKIAEEVESLYAEAGGDLCEAQDRARALAEDHRLDLEKCHRPHRSPCAKSPSARSPCTRSPSSRSPSSRSPYNRSPCTKTPCVKSRSGTSCSEAWKAMSSTRSKSCGGGPTSRATSRTTGGRCSTYCEDEWKDECPTIGCKTDYTATECMTTVCHTEEEKAAIHKALKKRLKCELLEAKKGTDIERIQAAVEAIQKHGFTMPPELETKINRRIMCLTLASKLRRATAAMVIHDKTQIEGIIKEIRCAKLETQMRGQIDMAKTILERLRSIEHLTRMIVNMNRQLVAEVKSYDNPPDGVMYVIKAVMILLGEPRSKLKTWRQVQSKFTQSTLKTGVFEFDIKSVSIEKARLVKSMLCKVTREEVAHVSQSLCMFYDWNKNVAEEVESLYFDSEVSLLTITEEE